MSNAYDELSNKVRLILKNIDITTLDALIALQAFTSLLDEQLTKKQRDTVSRNIYTFESVSCGLSVFMEIQYAIQELIENKYSDDEEFKKIKKKWEELDD